MEIRPYTVNTIAELTTSEQFMTLKHVPITKHRAVSHAHNPRASGEDKILFIAYENNEIAGYVGVLPDRIVHQDTCEKIGWLSCFWVDPGYRGKNISVSLFSCVMEAWDNKILITNMAPGTINFYLRTDLYRQPLYKTGIRGYLRFNLANILPPKNTIFKKAVPFLKALDFTGNIMNDARLYFYHRYKVNRNLRVEYRNDITPEAEEFIIGYNRQEFIKRGKPELEWILKYPWILEGSYGDHDSRRYYFSSVAERFICQCIQFYNDRDRMVGFLILSVRNDHLTVPYYYGEKESRKDIVKFLITQMRDLEVSMITIFQSELSEALNRLKSPLLFKKKILRPYLCPKALDITGLKFQDGDGDSAFT